MGAGGILHPSLSFVNLHYRYSECGTIRDITGSHWGPPEPTGRNHIMFRVAEDVRRCDYRRVSIAVGGNVRSALMSVLKHSPYNSNLDQGKKDALSSVLADKKSAEYGWATYICEYRGNLTECIIVHGDDMQHAVVVFDNGDTLQVIDLEEGQADRKRVV